MSIGSRQRRWSARHRVFKAATYGIHAGSGPHCDWNCAACVDHWDESLTTNRPGDLELLRENSGVVLLDYSLARRLSYFGSCLTGLMPAANRPEHFRPGPASFLLRLSCIPFSTNTKAPIKPWSQAGMDRNVHGHKLSLSVSKDGFRPTADPSSMKRETVDASCHGARQPSNRRNPSRTLHAYLGKGRFIYRGRYAGQLEASSRLCGSRKACFMNRQDACLRTLHTNDPGPPIASQSMVCKVP